MPKSHISLFMVLAGSVAACVAQGNFEQTDPFKPGYTPVDKYNFSESASHTILPSEHRSAFQFNIDNRVCKTQYMAEYDHCMLNFGHRQLQADGSYQYAESIPREIQRKKEVQAAIRREAIENYKQKVAEEKNKKEADAEKAALLMMVLAGSGAKSNTCFADLGSCKNECSGPLSGPATFDKVLGGAGATGTILSIRVSQDCIDKCGEQYNACAARR